MYEVCGPYIREYGKALSSREYTSSTTNGKLRDKLIHAVTDPKPQMIFLHDLADFTENGQSDSNEQGMLLHILHELCLAKQRGLNRTLVIAACQNGAIPARLAECAYLLDVPYPDAGEIKEIVDEALHECMDVDYFTPPPRLINEIAEAFRGFRASSIQNVIERSFSAVEFPLDNNAQDLFDRIVTAKRQILKKSGGLQWIDSDCDEVSGLELLRGWINDQKLFFHNFAACGTHREDFPKGVLVAGVPGSGKSLMAKNMARIWEIPLVKMGMGSLMGKYLGESEANVARALKLAEALSPCVLWIDELEKAFAGVNGDGENNQSMMRVFNSFLTWLQDRKNPCFVFATANNVAKLPSEFLRKERFDDKFFVFMPTAQECINIILSHLWNKSDAFLELKKVKNPGERECAFQVPALEIATEIVGAAAADGKFLTGADIASLIKSAFRTLFVQRFPQLNENDKTLAASQRVIYYTSSEIKGAVIAELKETKTYGENMAQVCGYWLSLLGDNPFRSASKPSQGRFDISQRNFIQETWEFNWKEAAGSGDYEVKLQALLADARRRQNYDDCFALSFALSLKGKRREEGGK